ncbi:MAG: hypothetical protein KJP00_08125 [Bacteroidia bacterium]|nr:hypothetical protein [Bacteroidia bacterium]
MKNLNSTEKIVYGFLIILFGTGAYLGFAEPEYFDGVFAAEDGFVEYGTALMLFAISVLCMYRLIKYRKTQNFLWILGVFGFFILFFFGAGEEISWGQRIFGIESGDFFIENNAQKETNLHNLVIGDTKINKLIFSQLLVVVLVLYLLITPILFRRKAWFSRLINRFAIPIPHWHHTIAFLVATGVVAIMTNGRRWELYELAFGAIFLLIFLYPLNRKEIIPFEE